MFRYLIDFKDGPGFSEGQGEHPKKGRNKLEHGLLFIAEMAKATHRHPSYSKAR
jgi:hypothetical protein